MAQLKYRDKHNQVGFLRKPDESAGFAEIVDFLRGSNLMYALTTNPTIYDSLVKQFWQTATAKTLADGTLELHTTIDTIAYTITKESIRSKLQLADASGITMLPNNEIFEGMGHMGNIATALICLSTGRVYNFSKLIFDGMVANLKSKTKFLLYPRFLQLILDGQTENKHPYLAVTLTKKIFGNMKRGFRGVPRPLLPAMLSIANPSAGQEAPSVTQPQLSSSVVPPTPPTTQPIPSEAITIPLLSQPAPPTPIAETTTASPSPTPSPAHEPMEHTFEPPSTAQQSSTPCQEATTSQLMAHIDDLEKQLKDTKQTFGKAILTLVERVKILEVALKRKTKMILLSDSEEEETEAQGRKFHDLDPLVSLLQELVTPSKTPSKTVNASGEEQVEDISPTTLEAAAILTKVKKIKSVDKGKRYKRRKSSKESAGIGLDFEEVKFAFEEVNTGGIKVSAGIKEINTGSLDVNTGIDPITNDSIRVSVPSPDRGRRERKAPMIEKEKTQASRKTKEQILQEEAGLAEAIKMAEEQELTEEQKKRKAQVYFEALSYTDEDWDIIRAKLEANAELKESVLGKDLTVEDYAKRMAELNQGTWKLTQLKKLNFEEVKAEFEKLVKQLDTYVPINFEATKEKKKVEEDKDDKPTKKTGKRRKQIARKGLHTHLDKDNSEDSDKASGKDDSTSVQNPINNVSCSYEITLVIANYPKIISKEGKEYTRL
ncbi:hypothetical protein Tco_1483410 [Tanacetum coccineum]